MASTWIGANPQIAHREFFEEPTEHTTYNPNPECEPRAGGVISRYGCRRAAGVLGGRSVPFRVGPIEDADQRNITIWLGQYRGLCGARCRSVTLPNTAPLSLSCTNTISNPRAEPPTAPRAPCLPRAISVPLAVHAPLPRARARTLCTGLQIAPRTHTEHPKMQIQCLLLVLLHTHLPEYSAPRPTGATAPFLRAAATGTGKLRNRSASVEISVQAG